MLYMESAWLHWICVTWYCDIISRGSSCVLFLTTQDTTLVYSAYEMYNIIVPSFLTSVFPLWNFLHRSRISGKCPAGKNKSKKEITDRVKSPQKTSKSPKQQRGKQKKEQRRKGEKKEITYWSHNHKNSKHQIQSGGKWQWRGKGRKKEEETTYWGKGQKGCRSQSH